ncbi:MAG: class I SAM-dependent methyltransferase [Kiloniellales bacterium]
MAQRWKFVGQPLRPGPLDVAIYEEVAKGWAGFHPGRKAKALLLGVTPEIAGMAWPAGCELLSIDRSTAMIAIVWPAPKTLPAISVCADWRQMPLRPGSRDLVFGDGCLALIPYPDGFREMIAALRAAIAEDGRLTLRFFARPEQREPLDAVFDDLTEGRIGNFNCFKWRLAMAVHGETSNQGVRLAEVWSAWEKRNIDPEELAAKLGWSVDVIVTLENYRDQATRYYFPTLREILAVFSERFVEQTVHLPGYEIGERCPIVVFAPR